MQVNTWLITFSPPRELTDRLMPVPVEVQDAERTLAAKRARIAAKMCPSPGCDNKRKQRSSGAYGPYCHDCEREKSRLSKRDARVRAKKAPRPENEQRRRKRLGLCAVRGCDNLRYTSPSGRVATRCIPCDHESQRLSRGRRAKRV